MLTDLKARNAKPRARDYKLADSGGLYLYVTTKGYRSWRMKYRFGGRERRLTFGPYPEASLTAARDKRDAAKRHLRDHRDPATEELKRRLAAAADQEETFESVARRWHALHRPRWKPVHAADVLKSLEREVFQDLGAIPIKQLDAPLVRRSFARSRREDRSRPPSASASVCPRSSFMPSRKAFAPPTQPRRSPRR